MLPGFRFLFAAIVFSLSILVFGFGAAALLHAAHEEFVRAPSWRGAPESRFAQQPEPTRPVLAVLRIEPEVTEPKPPENAAAIAAPAEPEVIAAAPAEAEKIAALKPDDSPPAEAAKPDLPVAQQSPPADAAVEADAPAAVEEPKIAPAEVVSQPASETIPAASAPDAPAASTKIATLGGPAAVTEAEPPANAARAHSERGSLKKRARARRARAAHHHRTVQRARAAARQATQQPASPFAAPTPAVGGG